MLLPFSAAYNSHHHSHNHHKLQPVGRHYSVVSTCYDQGTITASGEHVYIGEVASNQLPLGTTIRLDQPELGQSIYKVEDRIGSGSELDIFDPSQQVCINYGRRDIGFRVIP